MQKTQGNEKTNKRAETADTRAGIEIYRRKHWRKPTHKEKRIIEELKRKTNTRLSKVEDLIIVN